MISREVARTGGRRHYRAVAAERAAWIRAERPKCCRLIETAETAKLVEARPRERWSLQQISGWPVREYSEDDELQVLHETIYRGLFSQSRTLKPSSRRTCARDTDPVSPV